MTKKQFHVEVYGKDDFLIEDFQFDTKKEQLEKYHELLGRGYKKSDIIKITRLWYL